MQDRTGREIHEGSVLELHLNDMYSAVVMEAERIVNGQPCVIVQMVLTLPATNNVVGAYVTRGAEEFMPQVVTRRVQ